MPSSTISLTTRCTLCRVRPMLRDRRATVSGTAGMPIAPRLCQRAAVIPKFDTRRTAVAGRLAVSRQTPTHRAVVGVLGGVGRAVRRGRGGQDGGRLGDGGTMKKK